MRPRNGSGRAGAIRNRRALLRLAPIAKVRHNAETRRSPSLAGSSAPETSRLTRSAAARTIEWSSRSLPAHPRRHRLRELPRRHDNIAVGCVPPCLSRYRTDAPSARAHRKSNRVGLIDTPGLRPHLFCEPPSAQGKPPTKDRKGQPRRVVPEPSPVSASAVSRVSGTRVTPAADRMISRSPELFSHNHSATNTAKRIALSSPLALEYSTQSTTTPRGDIGIRRLYHSTRAPIAVAAPQRVSLDAG